jgi:hypothetical protein
MTTSQSLKRLNPAIAFLALLLLFAACSTPSPVVQGTVVSVAPDGKTIVLKDEASPEAQPQTFDISDAEIGAAPVEGDQVRLVYRAQGGTNVALRVMNITRQKAREASGH